MYFSAAAALDLSSLERQLTSLMASTSTAVTSVLYDNLNTARHANAGGADAQVREGCAQGCLAVSAQWRVSGAVWRFFGESRARAEVRFFGHVEDHVD